MRPEKHSRHAVLPETAAIDRMTGNGASAFKGRRTKTASK
jgi:hypothetical protein